MRALINLEVPKLQLMRERLLAEYPDLDNETLADTLEGITDLNEMISAVIRSALVDEALHAGLRFRLDDMKERLSRLELRASKKRELALEAMTRLVSASSSSQTLPHLREQAVRRSCSALRTRYRKPTNCRSLRNSIAKRFSQSSSAGSRSPARK